MNETKPYTALSADRIVNLIKYVSEASVLPGLMAEFGVFEGGSLNVIMQHTPSSKTIYGIDSFEGLPELNKEHDLSTWNICKGGMVADYETVKAHFAKFSNVVLLKGWFPEVMNQLPTDLEFCFVHIDVDLYQSVKDACEYFYPRLVQGGIMLFDDYDWIDTPGAKVAIHEFFGGLNYNDIPSVRKEICREDGSLQFQYLIIK